MQFTTMLVAYDTVIKFILPVASTQAFYRETSTRPYLYAVNILFGSTPLFFN